MLSSPNCLGSQCLCRETIQIDRTLIHPNQVGRKMVDR